MKRKFKIHIFVMSISILLLQNVAFSQNTSIIQGVVKNTSGQVLSGASIQSGKKIATSDEKGIYHLSLSPGEYSISINLIGFQDQKKKITLSENQVINLDWALSTDTTSNLNNVVVIGSRAAPRTSLTSPVPVDVFDIKKIASLGAQTTVGQILNYVAPSFTSTSQSLGDGTDEVDPISLRGLGPDQVLVLVNGKRRYTSALVNVNGTFGKGTVGTDLNAIPVAAIDRIEVLRDGAAAQYGSDAVAGVINIILKHNVNQFNASVTAGEYATRAKALNETFHDGQSNQIALNYGIPLTSKGGYINFSGSFDYRKPTNRGGIYTGSIYNAYGPDKTAAGALVAHDQTDSFLNATGTSRRDYSLIVGQSRIRSGQFAYNASLPLSNNATLYSFGTFGYRNGLAAGFYRYPNDTRNIPSIYPLGYMPYIGTSIYDKSIAVGIKGKTNNGWNVDFSNTYGQNQFEYHVQNSLNASMGTNSPTSFNNGGPKFSQNTVNLDLNRDFDWLSGVNLAFGGEYRYEHYQLIAGDANSYTNYGLADSVGVNANGTPILVLDPNGSYNTLFGRDGNPVPGGSQVFSGFRPANAANATRSAVAGYADAAVNFTKKFLVDGAIRYENYSDFGSTLNGKLSFLYKLTENLSLRGSGSTGFRAPSLQQIYYANTATQFTNGVAYEVGTFTNGSRAAKLLGIPSLKPEKSKSVSAGVTGRFGKFTATVDGYFTRVNDRIVYTDQFSGSNAAGASAADQELYQILAQAGAQKAQFFANAINTETKGIDAVFSYTEHLGKGTFRADLSGTISQTQKVGPVHASELLKGKESTYFSPASLIYLTNAVPKQKLNLGLNYNISKWIFFVRNNYFGGVTEPVTTVANQQFYNPRWVTDVSIGYQIIKEAKVTIGSNNVFNVYPETINIAANSNSGQFVYPRATSQFGFNGRYVFARVELSL
ncbi:TonB-dependent receptor [Rhizosphaericola mali]|uniref:TonB-dependent receptor n=1 Tax=Rhizosphaericola mali TaxID=2545455 RepID=A0A5P2G6S6_9BACT|nr:TonB-dependent receptor [Rhizosphaericola mali]QES89969.1 TonB-dependent receptor [Rhizosphaericola mali]